MEYKNIMKLAKIYANLFSDDPTTAVGAIFIDDNNQILSIGCNHSPYIMKLNSQSPKNKDKYYGTYINSNTGKETKEKYNWIEHAERNAIFNALNNGVSLNNSICVTTLIPCINCTKAIISVGCKKIISFMPCKPFAGIWEKEFNISKQLLAAAGIEYNLIDINENDLVINIDVKGWEKDKVICNNINGGRRKKMNKTKRLIKK
jgi:deoxycytidylate deaminase